MKAQRSPNYSAYNTWWRLQHSDVFDSSDSSVEDPKDTKEKEKKSKHFFIQLQTTINSSPCVNVWPSASHGRSAALSDVMDGATKGARMQHWAADWLAGRPCGLTGRHARERIALCKMEKIKKNTKTDSISGSESSTLVLNGWKIHFAGVLQPQRQTAALRMLDVVVYSDSSMYLAVVVFWVSWLKLANVPF